MAKKLVYACLEDEEESSKAVLVGDNSDTGQQPTGQRKVAHPPAALR